MGLKGAGEGGTNAAGAAIAAAVDDALDAPGFVTRLPIRPLDVTAPSGGAGGARTANRTPRHPRPLRDALRRRSQNLYRTIFGTVSNLA